MCERARTRLSLCPQAASQLQTCSSLGCQQAASSLPPPSSRCFFLVVPPPPPLPSPLPLLEEHSGSGCLILEAVQQQRARWLSGWAADGRWERWQRAPAPAAGTEAAMEILLIIRFCCNCTYGNPGPSRGRWCFFPPLGAGWSGLKCGRQGLGGSGEGRGRKWLDLRLPRFTGFQPEIEVWGPLGAGTA